MSQRGDRMASVQVKPVRARRSPAPPAVPAAFPPPDAPAPIETMVSAKALRFTRQRLDAAKKKITALIEAVRSHPMDAGAAVELAKAYIGLGRFSAARTVLRSHPETGGGRASALADGAGLLFEMGFYSEAAEWFAKAVAIPATDAAGLLKRHRIALSAMGQDARRGGQGAPWPPDTAPCPAD